MGGHTEIWRIAIKTSGELLDSPAGDGDNIRIVDLDVTSADSARAAMISVIEQT